MPSRDEHLGQARRNKEFCDAAEPLSDYDHRDWVVTAAFYAALHLVDAVLAGDGLHPALHSTRDSHVRRHCRNAYPDYRSLKDLSRNSRYSCGDVPTETEVRTGAFRHANQVASEIARLLSLQPFPQGFLESAPIS